jgi:hypothetical protein
LCCIPVTGHLLSSFIVVIPFSDAHAVLRINVARVRGRIHGFNGVVRLLRLDRPLPAVDGLAPATAGLLLLSLIMPSPSSVNSGIALL